MSGEHSICSARPADHPLTSACISWRAVAAHSLDALDRRIAGTARRARATRDETTAALAVSALRERARAGRRPSRPSRAPSSETVVCGQPSTFLPTTDADDASSLSSFAAADSDDGGAFDGEYDSPGGGDYHRPGGYGSPSNGSSYDDGGFYDGGW